MKDTLLRRLAPAATAGALAATVLLCTAPPSSAATSSTPVKIAVILKNDSDPYWITVFSGARMAAKTLGSKATVSYAAGASESDILGQINKIQDAVTAGAQAIVVAPSEPSEDISVLNKAVAAGVKVIIVDTPTSGPDTPGWTKYVTFIGTNNFSAGQIGGQELLKAVGHTGDIAIINGGVGVTSTELRTAGFMAAIKGTNIKVVSNLPTNPSCALSPGTTDAENILTAHPNLVAIWSPCGGALIGAIPALAADHDTGKVKLFGQDVASSFGSTPADVTQALHAFQTGQVTASVNQQPILMGDLGVLDAYKAVEGISLAKSIDSGTSIMTKQNAAQILK